jgi:hypothetical protein
MLELLPESCQTYMASLFRPDITQSTTPYEQALRPEPWPSFHGKRTCTVHQRVLQAVEEFWELILTTENRGSNISDVSVISPLMHNIDTCSLGNILILTCQAKGMSVEQLRAAIPSCDCPRHLESRQWIIPWLMEEIGTVTVSTINLICCNDKLNGVQAPHLYGGLTGIPSISYMVQFWLESFAISMSCACSHGDKYMVAVTLFAHSVGEPNCSDHKMGEQFNIVESKEFKSNSYLCFGIYLAGSLLILIELEQCTGTSSYGIKSRVHPLCASTSRALIWLLCECPFPVCREFLAGAIIISFAITCAAKLYSAGGIIFSFSVPLKPSSACEQPRTLAYSDATTLTPMVQIQSPYSAGTMCLGFLCDILHSSHNHIARNNFDKASNILVAQLHVFRVLTHDSSEPDGMAHDTERYQGVANTWYLCSSCAHLLIQCPSKKSIMQPFVAHVQWDPDGLQLLDVQSGRVPTSLHWLSIFNMSMSKVCVCLETLLPWDPGELTREESWPWLEGKPVVKGEGVLASCPGADRHGLGPALPRSTEIAQVPPSREVHIHQDARSTSSGMDHGQAPAASSSPTSGSLP